MNKVVYKNANVLDIKTGVYTKKDLYVEDGHLVNAFSENVSNLKTVDLNGMYVLPGMINLHVHMFGTGKPSKVLGGGNLQAKIIGFMKTKLGHLVLRALISSAAKQQLLSGVTTVRGVGDFEYQDVYVRDMINKGKKDGARILCCGPAITVPGGHGDGTFSDTGKTEEELRALVQDRRDHHVDWIKICITGGVMDAKKKGEPGEVKMNLEETTWVCDEAHKLGFKVASHTESPEGMKIAILGGVDTVEHGAPYGEELANVLKERDGAIVATMTPAIPLAKLDTSITKLSEFTQYNANVVFENIVSAAKETAQYGNNLGLGTDASCPLCTQYGTWRELYYFTKYLGMTPLQAYQVATLNNAKILGLENFLGAVEVGKYADFIVAKEDPMQNILALRNLTYVVKEGKMYKSNPKLNKEIDEELDALL